ncbi:ABC transporter ATP-binding protein [Amnibacterium setariae]|uniref:ATP-binding cassette domain-containing protein n=1 Tax=Amnibacterium setariae TaxID=2306585 RepID=A0A3A1U645_9MICO|nr:oligopeptide/dipeptide ABC transporter ATP-binding protein [Amnibacterium setariae]RIX30927.1 ATP-binding cassette domain-containing protein [Amnibacterium setariae]
MTSTASQPAPAATTRTGEPLLEVQGVEKYFPGRRTGLLGQKGNPVKAVDGVSFSLGTGETLGLVGESGCGKSTTGRAVSKLIEPTGGTVRFEGRDVTNLSPRQMRPLRRELQMIFQDPYSSLNPRHTIGTVIGAPFAIQGERPKGGTKRAVQGLMERVGLNPEHYNRYPHEFSGGQRQRIGIARALALRPKLIVCDEPVSALDVSVQAQVVNLLEDLQSEFGLAYIFIAHDLSVVRHISDRVAVMYLGKIMEITDRDTLYEAPMHPYTHALLSAVPVPDPTTEARREKILLTGDLPSPSNPPSGCVFHTRCPKYKNELSESEREHCRTVEPVIEEKRPGQSVYCHFPQVRSDLIDGEPGPIRTTKPKAA